MVRTIYFHISFYIDKLHPVFYEYFDNVRAVFERRYKMLHIQIESLRRKWGGVRWNLLGGSISAQVLWVCTSRDGESHLSNFGGPGGNENLYECF